MATLKNISSRFNKAEVAYGVFAADGRYLGYIRKFRDTARNRCPWQAFKAPADNLPLDGPCLLGSFYPLIGTDAKASAINAVTAATS